MAFIFQIYYDEKTRAGVDPAYTPYDNSKPEDGTWFEYSAIRKILKSGEFRDGDYVGIFSPRFYEKTGMTGTDVLDVVNVATGEVISFSPSISQSAAFINSFYQGEAYHPGLMSVGQEVSEALGLRVDIKSLWQDQTRIIFSNYFVARFSFWKKWFAAAEELYRLANDASSSLYGKLNAACAHREREDMYQFKVFVLERLVSLILEKNALDAQLGLDYGKYLTMNRDEGAAMPIFLTLDALKAQYLKTKKTDFAQLYQAHLSRMMSMGSRG